MPPNNAPLKRKADEPHDGTSYLPLARVRKIIKLDSSIDACTPASAFLISLAAEEFIWYLSEAAHKMTKVEKKPRKNIQYKDLANAVARIDNLEFLSDVVPRTVPFGRAVLQKKAVGTKKKNEDGGEKEDAGGSGAIMNITEREEEEDGEDSESPASETRKLKELHLSNQPSGSGTKKGRKASRDLDGDLMMQ